jgi:hypothetical protein
VHERFFAAEVVIHGSQIGVRSRGDLSQGHRFVAAFYEQRLGRLEQPPAGIARTPAERRAQAENIQLCWSAFCDMRIQIRDSNMCVNVKSRVNLRQAALH